jgi:hypothetical protein
VRVDVLASARGIVLQDEKQGNPDNRHCSEAAEKNIQKVGHLTLTVLAKPHATPRCPTNLGLDGRGKVQSGGRLTGRIPAFVAYDHGSAAAEINRTFRIGSDKPLPEPKDMVGVELAVFAAVTAAGSA